MIDIGALAWLEFHSHDNYLFIKDPGNGPLIRANINLE